MFKFLDMFRRNRMMANDSPEKAAFQKKYRHFQNLLSGNNRALEIITELEEVCYGHKPFGLEFIIGQTERLASRVYDIAEDLNALSGGKYPELFEVVENVSVKVLRDLVQKRTLEKTALTVPLQHISMDRLSEVGGKAANLGEIYNRVHLPVPRGFGVTAYACLHFMESNNLYEQADLILKGLDVEDTERLVDSSEKIKDMILAAPLPQDLEKALFDELLKLEKAYGTGIHLAVRSSATSEDSEASFAGQHSSVLGVTRENLTAAYKKVVASTFNPRAIYYRRKKGYPDEYVIMSVLCVMMVDAQASGVMYTRDPNDHRRNVILINSVWGLGVGAVDGSLATDFFEIDKHNRELTIAKTAIKPSKLVLTSEGTLQEAEVEPEFQSKPTLTPDQIQVLVNYGLTLEEHYHQPLDVEWALDVSGRIIILQTRPLSVDIVNSDSDTSKNSEASAQWQIKCLDHPILIREGTTASRGKASGLAYILTSDHNLLNIPEGSILIAPQTSPRYVAILGRVQAIVTDVGSVTGHMASVAREFGVPTLVGTGNATSIISQGQEITVDATNAIVYEGRVESILERKRPVNPMVGSPIYKKAHQALKKLTVLNLTNPELDNFCPEGCQTLHDVIRFAHEMSMREMFRISDDLEVNERFAIKFKAPLPMKIFLVDLGGGLEIPPDASEATLKHVRSLPFYALLKGMTHPEVSWTGHIGVDWKGFATILAESVLRDPTLDERMGGPNYVVISRDYLNFNSRLGYHFAVVDAFCGSHVNDNYITFSFKGGAADIGRRSRRALLIGGILKRLGFKTTIKGDMVQGEFKKYECLMMEEKLDMIGRLLGAVRLLDMVLSDEGQIEWYVEEFFKGNYTFSRDFQGSRTVDLSSAP